MQSEGDTNMTASAKGHGQVFQAGRDIVISGQPHANARKLTVLNVAAAGQILTDMASNAATLDEAVVIVADMEPEVAASRLAAMPPESAAQILARMDHQLARQRLIKVNGEMGAIILTHMPAVCAAELAVKIAPEKVLKLLIRMAPERAAAILAELPDMLVARLLIEIPARFVNDKLAKARSVSTRLHAFPIRIQSIESLLTRLSDAQVARVVAAAPVDDAAQVLAILDDAVLAERGSVLLSQVDDPCYLARFLAVIAPVWRAGSLLAVLPNHRLGIALAGVSDVRAALLLAQVPEKRAVQIMRQMPLAKQERIKLHLW